MMFLIELFGMKYFVRILSIPKYYLMPVIMALCVVGTYGTNSQIFDILGAIVFGAIGMVMEKYGFPITPFLLGFLLGGIMESNLIRGIQYARGDLIGGLLGSPIAMVFLVVAFLALVWTIISRYRKARQAQ